MTWFIRNAIMSIRLATSEKWGLKEFTSVSKKRRSLPPIFVGLFNDKYLVGPCDPDFDCGNLPAVMGDMWDHRNNCGTIKPV